MLIVPPSKFTNYGFEKPVTAIPVTIQPCDIGQTGLRDYWLWARLTGMCGRFALTLPTDAVAGWFDAVAVNMEPAPPRYNICPTQTISVAVSFEGARKLVPMRWGFIPRWFQTLADGPLLINARSETVAQKPAFRAAVQTRRCLVPASGFFEWYRPQGAEKQPWYFYPNESDLMAFAGIWQVWTGSGEHRTVTCAMLTTAAGSEMSDVHHREPVVIQPDGFALWLGEKGKGASTLLGPAPDGFYRRHKVSREVNSGRLDMSSLIEPLDSDPPDQG